MLFRGFLAVRAQALDESAQVAGGAGRRVDEGRKGSTEAWSAASKRPRVSSPRGPGRVRAAPPG